MHQHQDQILNQEIIQLRQSLSEHAVFKAIRELSDLRGFMQIHVYAVWDFMSLVKRLQRDLTCVQLPWLPPQDPAAARLINDIVLAEESDVGADGAAASHLDLYLGAMREVGADTRDFEAFIARLAHGEDPAAALGAATIPAFVREFVAATLDTALNGSTLDVMASFFYGRENVIPDMFQGLLGQWGLSRSAAPQFVYYLDRHIELDADSHGPAASELISRQLARRPSALKRTRQAAIEALRARGQLWDGSLDHLLRQRRLAAELEPA